MAQRLIRYIERKGFRSEEMPWPTYRSGLLPPR